MPGREIRVFQVGATFEQFRVIGRHLDDKDVPELVDGDVHGGSEAGDLVHDPSGLRIHPYDLGVTGNKRDEAAVLGLCNTREERDQNIPVPRIDGKSRRHRLLTTLERCEHDDFTSITVVERDGDELVERALCDE